MKVYILTTKKTVDKRLVNGKPATYPACLPDPELVFGKTSDDISIDLVPSWFNPRLRERGAGYIIGAYCCYLGHLTALRNHYAKYPDEDYMILEDDVVFRPDFCDCYERFMQLVPNDWGIIDLGSWADRKTSFKEVLPGVLKQSDIIYSTECFIIRSTTIPILLRLLENYVSSKYHELDLFIFNFRDIINTYLPILSFAYQADGMSLIRCGHKSLKNRYSYRVYEDINGSKRVATPVSLNIYYDGRL